MEELFAIGVSLGEIVRNRGFSLSVLATTPFSLGRPVQRLTLFFNKIIFSKIHLTLYENSDSKGPSFFKKKQTARMRSQNSTKTTIPYALRYRIKIDKK
jgi:hypothetical protein